DRCSVGRCRERLDIRANALGDPSERAAVSHRYDDRKLLAAVTSGKIDGANRHANHPRRALQCVVAGEMSVAIVVVLESIEVEHENAETLTVARRPLNLDVDALAERAKVRQIGEIVRAGARFELL